ncbi:MAG: FAD-binding oxidoreductase [Desulfobacterales bacterium]|nr:MAG: FAD-binding oxidoreductase [Desulfobacterales bacterium]
MRRWNGWGDDTIRMDLPPKGLALLQDLIGEGRVQPDYPLERYLERVPASRLPRHPLISEDPKLRLNHAHGQSLPDWIGMRGGLLQCFPDGVALPTKVEDVHALLKFAADNDVVVIPFGGGTSVVGHLDVPETDRPVLSLSLAQLNRLIQMDPDCRLATFESGICGPDIENHLNPKGFTLGHYPQSFEYSTLGGWVVTRSNGQQSRHYGRIEQLFAGGEILTPQGSMQLQPFPASAAGPDLRQLLLGSEGRMGILTKVTVKISRLPEIDDVFALFFPSWNHAHDGVQDLAGSDLPFSMVRLSNPKETMTILALAGRKGQVKLLQQYLSFRGISKNEACLCLIGFIGSRRLTRAAKRESFAILRRHQGVAVGKAIGTAWKKNRFRSAYLRNTLWDLGYAVDTLETALKWDKVTSTLKSIETALNDVCEIWNEPIHVFTHLSHVYKTGSSIYTTFVFRLADTPQKTLDQWKALKHAASQAVVNAGGTISHQHGVGLDHKNYLQAEKGTLGTSTLKTVFDHLDPDQRMNPGKLVP